MRNCSLKVYCGRVTRWKDITRSAVSGSMMRRPDDQSAYDTIAVFCPSASRPKAGFESRVWPGHASTMVHLPASSPYIQCKDGRQGVPSLTSLPRGWEPASKQQAVAREPGRSRKPLKPCYALRLLGHGPSNVTLHLPGSWARPPSLVSRTLSEMALVVGGTESQG